MPTSRRLPPPPAAFRPLGGPLQHAVPYASDAAARLEQRAQDGLAALRGTVRDSPAGWLALAFGLGILLASRRAR
ncbi:hypothetical protein BKE38_16720 [Pseudoroseomonas deserti]|uniref:Uncharacterized protein n=1 Tax=Teichococcus deserti TaxID=1817963 RepID=A0A1V2GZQ7_9PROT|nr:hypothetical protein [Pseudoroseomonas deserti]ONG51080.1 hypothetical protein BKE38_16720 [Pseudoroseomonas deserti]